MTIDGGEDNDYIENRYDPNVSITAGAGDDTINNEWGSNVTIDAGAGDDYIYNLGSHVTVDAGDGDDYISSTNNSYGSVYVTISGGAGNDSIDNGSSEYVSINAGSGDDTIYNSGGSNVTINAGDGNDSILNDGSDSVTIDAGAGNDSIYLNGGSALINYKAGDGNDLITGFNGYSTLKISGGTYIRQISGDDLILTVGDGKITLQGAATLSTLNIEGEENKLLTLTEGDDTYTNTLDNVAINPLGGNDLIRGFNATSTLSVDGDYRTAFAGDDLIVTTSVGSVTLEGVAINGEEVYMNSWHLDGTTATYGSVAETLVTIDGVKSLDGISSDGNTITIAASALNKMLVTVSDGYTLKLGSDVTKTSTTKNWSLDGTTVSYKQTVTNSIVYSAPSCATLAEIKGTTSTAFPAAARR